MQDERACPRHGFVQAHMRRESREFFAGPTRCLEPGSLRVEGHLCFGSLRKLAAAFVCADLPPGVAPWQGGWAQAWGGASRSEGLQLVRKFAPQLVLCRSSLGRHRAMIYPGLFDWQLCAVLRCVIMLIPRGQRGEGEG